MNNSRQTKFICRLCRSCLASLLFSLALTALAKVGDPPPSTRHQVLPIASIAELALPATDVQKELAADTKSKILSPYRYAVGQKVSVTPTTHGTWEKVSSGYLWRLKISSPGATDLNLGFTTFSLPEGATLHIASTTENYYQGPYTSEDNTPQKQLWTPVVPGDNAVVELFVPSNATQQVELTLTQVSGGYRDLFHRRKELNNLKSESCEIDVACAIAQPWAKEIRSVARYSISGTTLCSGTLIADAAGDLRNYFLTANHCGLTVATAPTVVVYWNYQSPTCGQHGGGSLAENQSGATFRAAKYDVDFALIELNAVPDRSFDVYYAGWDRTGVAPSGCIGIHHPNADEKSISFSSNSLVTIDSCVGTGGINSHWKVTWTLGVTEPGSSGSGIWNPSNHRLIGTLSGGSSDCSNLSGYDCYGKFSVAWTSGTSSTTRLKDWLDPLNTGITGVNGIDPNAIVTLVADGYSLDSESCGPPNNAIDPGETVTVELKLKNTGHADTTNLVAKLLPGGGVLLPSDSQTYGVITAGGPDVSRPFTFTASGECGGKIVASLRLQDGTKVKTNKFIIPIGAANWADVFSENFDGVTPPSLPVGWSSTASGSGAAAWVTSASPSDTAPNSAFGSDSANITDEVLVSPSFPISSASSQVTFRHSYGLETGYDGGVLEISTNGGAFKDIISAGGSFVANGYNASIPTSYSNPLGNRNAWSGNSGGFVTTTVNLPAAAAGKNVRLRWRLGTDDSNGSTGWYVDSVSISEITNYSCCSLAASDGTLPNLQIASHSDMQILETDRITLSGTASDAGTGDNGIAFVKVNGVRASGDSTSGSGIAAWSKVVNLSVGLNTITVLAADFAGNSASNTIHLISDSARPTMAITYPTAGLRVTNTPGPLIVRGRASDNVQVTNVQFWFNSGPWMDVVTTNGWTNWTASIDPIARTNLIKAYSVDEAGHHSVTNALNFIYVVPSPLTLITNGSGAITRSFAGNILEVGRTYTATAVPGAGQVFYGWSGDLKATNAALTFVMQSNMVLQANFIPNPFPKAVGTYYGLFAESNRAQTHSGFLTLSAGPHGGFSASLVRGTNTFSFTGGFDVYGMAYATAISAGTNSWNVAVSLDLAGGEDLSGTIGNSQWTAYLEAHRAIFAATNPATQFIGKYTLVIPGSGVPNGSASDGDSYATVSVGPAGYITLSGSLSDGNALNQVVPISGNGDWPLYQSRYAGKGSVWGWLVFDTNNSAAAITGDVSWIKQAVPGATYYPMGFTNLAAAHGSRYATPSSNTSRVIQLTNGIVVFEGGNLSGSFANDVTLTETNSVINDGTNGLNLIINLTNGTFSGNVQVPGTLKSNTFKGALLLDQAIGSGFFLGTNQSGRVSLQPEP